MAAETARPANHRAARPNPKPANPERVQAPTAPPMPKGRDGVPLEGPPPHGEETARPTDTGRHGA
jgi:hypothetical protein